MKYNYKNIKYLFNIIWIEDKQLFLLLLFDILITSLSKYPFIILPKYILDNLLYGKNFILIVFLIIIMILSDMIFSIIRNYISRNQKQHSKRLEFQLHTNVTNKTLEMAYEKLLNPETYDKMYLASDIANGNNFINLIEDLKGLFSNLIIMISMIYIIAQVDIFIMIATVIVVVVNSITGSKIQKRLLKTKRETSKTIRELEYIGKLAWHIDYAKEVRLYDCKKIIGDKYYKFNEIVLSKIFKDFKIENNGKTINSVAGAAQMIILYLSLGWKLFNKKITAGDFTLNMNAVNSFKGAIQGLLSNIIGIEMHSKYFSAYIEYMEMAPIDNTIQSLNIISEQSTYDGFRFNNVFYKYPGQEEFALENINVSIKYGEKISLVGENGAGKTTFILLLLKLIQPSSGTIYCDGVDINAIPDREYWNRFSTVFQDFKIFNFSVLENIKMSSDREVNDELIMLLKDCGIYDSIELLNNKIYSIIGHEFDIEGVDFSGGQRQKLAIARAMYKNGNIIILDEPTAALDAKAENEIFSQMKTLAKEKTAIFISHRLYSARFCDRILVFASHKIIEDGTHEVLLKQKGLYCEMFNLQAQYYEGDDI